VPNALRPDLVQMFAASKRLALQLSPASSAIRSVYI